MSIRIKDITIENLGPIKKFDMELGKLNVIYGKNGTGKTMLTEFLIKSLFKNTKHWETNRNPEGFKGKVSIEGLKNGSIDDFYPKKNQEKLYEKWDYEKNGLPSNFSSLLVVKDAIPSISSAKEGIDYNSVKELLSEEDTLNKIDGKIQATIREAKIDENLEIEIPRRGIGIKYKAEKEKIDKFESIYKSIQDNYSEAERKELTNKIKDLEKAISDLDEAKKHKAYKLNKEIDEQNIEMKHIPEKTIDNLRSYNKMKSSIKFKKGEIKIAKDKSKNHDDLCQIEINYNAYKEKNDSSLSLKSGTKKINYITYLVLVLAAITLLLPLADLLFYITVKPWLYIISLILLFIFSYMYFKKITASYNQTKNDIKKIEDRYKKLTGKDLDPAGIRTLIIEKKKHKDIYEHQESELGVEEKQLYELENLIQGSVPHLLEKSSLDDLAKTVDLLENERNDIKKNISGLRETLASLDVDELDYISEYNGIKYSKSDEKTKKDELETRKEELAREKSSFNALKVRLLDATGNPSETTATDELIEMFSEVVKESENEYKNLEVEIIGQNIVHEVIGEFKGKEFLTIKAGLESEEMKKYLKLMTRFNQITFGEEEEIVISSDTDDRNLLELSRGEKESVMFAMRVAFCAKLAKKNRLFLILDDAFQHCDMNVRENLIDQLFTIVNEGWQVIYLTMDEQIMELFDIKGKSIDNYKKKTL